MTERCDYRVRLEGVDARDLSLSVLRDVCDLLLEGAQRAARLFAEGRSVARGSAPAWLVAAADLRVFKYEPGSLDLAISAPVLHESALELFAQQPPESPQTPRPGKTTAFDLLLAAVEDAVLGRRDSERLDKGMLEVLAKTGALFARGTTRLSMSRSGAGPVIIDQGAARVIQALAEETPPPRIERVRGMLDALTVSSRACVLRLEGGRTLRGLTAEELIDELKPLLGEEIVVEGLVTFRPSGEALRIEIDYVSPAQPGDAIWARTPRAETGVQKPAAPASYPELRTLFGQWPGDETEEQLFKALESLS